MRGICRRDCEARDARHRAIAQAAASRRRAGCPGRAPRGRRQTQNGSDVSEWPNIRLFIRVARPVQAVHSAPPGWVGPVDLVVAVSLSGAAEGPLAVAAEAARRGCRLLTVGAAGSPLADVSAQARGIHVPVARDLRSSRSSLWALAVPVLMGAAALGLVDMPAYALSEAADTLDDVAERARPSSETFVNRPRAWPSISRGASRSSSVRASSRAWLPTGRPTSWPGTPGTPLSPASSRTLPRRSWRPSTGRSRPRRRRRLRRPLRGRRPDGAAPDPHA